MIKVALVKQENYNPEEIHSKLEEVLSASGILELVSGKKVLLKPNCTEAFLPEEGRTTHPQVLRGTIKLLQSADAAVKIGESSSVGIDTSSAYRSTGIAKIAEELSVELIDFKKSRYQEVKIDNGLILKKIKIPTEIFSADYLFSLAKLKTNYVSGISGTIKNLKGLLKDADKKRFHHLGIAPALADLMSCLPPTLGLVDGILGSELDEPKKGKVLAASVDLVAADYACAKIMGLEPYSVDHLRLAAERGSGGDISLIPSELEIIGGEISSFSTKFKSQPPGTESLEQEYQVFIKDGQACSSCLGALYLSFKKVKTQRPELLSILAGKEMVLGDYSGEINPEALLFGNCAVHKNKSFGTAVRGCVPTTSDFISGLLQSEKMKKQYNDAH
ncbi:DUF362 domain-containing protein [Candidatus Woesearchaeota archaeon]|nr:DUF362 domain-containing protein [Candidatus Woesearchaeota archaeon]